MYHLLRCTLQTRLSVTPLRVRRDMVFVAFIVRDNKGVAAHASGARIQVHKQQQRANKNSKLALVQARSSRAHQ